MATYDKEIDYINSEVYLKLKDRSIYGSSRVGVRSTDIDMLALHNPNYSMKSVKYEIGKRTYELSNHLGNVLSVISDKPIPSFEHEELAGMLADVRVAQDYSPFGVTLSGSSFEVDGGYRYGFQNQEKDDEIKGAGNSVNYTYRMHDTRLGRFFAVDPLTKKYPHYTPYSFSGNKVIHCIELEGLEEWNLSQGYTSMETFYGPFSNEYLNGQQGKVNYYDGLRTDASIALNKIEAQNIQITVYPMSLSPVIIYDVPIKIKRENSFAYAQVATLDDGTEEIWIHPGLGGKSHDFQVSVLIHEYSAHYMEGVLNLIPDTDNVIFFDGMEENLMFNPNKPESPNNPKMVQSWYSLGPVSTAKEEVNGWGLQKHLHESGILNYTQDEYNAVLKNVLNYVSKVDKLIKQEESNQLNEK